MEVRLTHIDGKLPNLALMKLAHWHRSKGDGVTLARTPSPSMFEPVHGAAFDITGKGIANPLATVSAVAMMLDHLGERAAAQKLDDTVARCLNERRVLTPDLGGSATPAQVGDEVVRVLKET